MEVQQISAAPALKFKRCKQFVINIECVKTQNISEN
jgi:hypothetical protein